MKLGIMQPYFLPYIGYWQLMNAVDKYVIYDDVNYIKGGWINRNNLLMNGAPHLFTIPLIGMSPYKKINEIQMMPLPATFLKTVSQTYAKAPFFNEVYPLLESIVSYETHNLATFLENSIRVVAGYLSFNTEFIVSSTLNKDNALKGQDKVISICKLLGASEYYNAIGGQELYSKEVFLANGVRLSFVKTGKIVYRQMKEEFVPNLSILDVLMFNSKQTVIQMLKEYTLEG